MRKALLAIAATLAIAIVPAIVTSAAPRSARRSRIRRPRARHEDRIGELVVVRRSTSRRSGGPGRGASSERASGGRGGAGLARHRRRRRACTYPKLYTLRGVGTNIEVWVASDEDDVSVGNRLPGGRLSQRRRAQRGHGRAGPVPDRPVRQQHVPDRVGRVQRRAVTRRRRCSLLRSEGPRPSVPDDYYGGPGDRIVVLVDNVRDDNFFDTNNGTGSRYIAGLLLLAVRRLLQPAA